uniref:Cytochrome c oxidase subunit VIb n=1 Tax=Ditylenchus dipsaci TaxID=166011 RepID=A0A915EGX8_9BILA
MDIPDTTGERLEKFWEKNGPVFPHPDHPGWYDKGQNETLSKELSWAAPYDARYPQIRKQRHCFDYYTDFFRCKELMGDDYQPCKFFQNVYKDMCKTSWTDKWDEWRENNAFPARFDR